MTAAKASISGSLSSQVSPEALSFELVPNTQPGCPLSITNSSSCTIAFKVKTTEPKRYLVRPNQGLIRSGETTPANVYLIEKECNDLCQAPATIGNVVDKFLVQTALVENEFLQVLASSPKQSEELTKLWASFSKSEIQNKKLPVQLHLPPTTPTATATAFESLVPPTATTAATTTTTNAIKGQQQQHHQQQHQQHHPTESPASSPYAPRQPSTANGSNDTSPYGSQNSSPGGVAKGKRFAPGSEVRRDPTSRGGGGRGIDEDSRVLASKYEHLVNYTANLTEERDELNQSLEEAKKALQREMATRIALESKGQISHGRKGSGRNGAGVRPPANHSRGGDGFGIVTLFFVAILFFFLGHWLDLAGGPVGAQGGISMPEGVSVPGDISTSGGGASSRPSVQTLNVVEDVVDPGEDIVEPAKDRGYGDETPPKNDVTPPHLNEF